MSGPSIRAIYTSATLRTAQRLLVPLLLALGVSWICVGTTDPLRTTGITATTSSALWLHLPALLLTGFALLIAVDDWPMFARDRDDAVWVRRFLSGPFRGCVVFGSGVLTALAIALTLLACGFAMLLSARSGAEAPRGYETFVQADGRETAELRPQQERVELVRATGQDELVDTIVLRALPVRPPGGDLLTPIRLEVWAEGERLGDGERVAEIASFSDRFEVHFAPRRLPRIELRRAADHGDSGDPRDGDNDVVDGRLGALFPAHAVEAVLATPHSHLANVALATLTYLLAAACALAIATALRDQLSTGVVTTLLLGAMVGVTLFEATPQIQAIRACAEGRWLGVEPLRTPVLVPIAAIAGLLLVSAMVSMSRRSTVTQT